MIQTEGEPAAKVYKRKLYEAGIPYTMFGTEDLDRDYARMKANGVRFTMEPTKTDFGRQAVFDDTCGNLIMITQLG